MYHYVYRITDIGNEKYYIGVRSCRCKPIDDIGIRYFSSSTNKDFILSQKTNPLNFRYKVIRTFETRVEAVAFEMKIHQRCKVNTNTKFYNRAIQNNSKFSTPGGVFISGEWVASQDFDPKIHVHHLKGLVTVLNKDGIVMQVKMDDADYVKGNYVHISKDRVPAIDSSGKSCSISRKEYYSGEYTCNNTGKVPAVDIHGNRKLVSKEDFATGEYKHVSHGLVTCIDTVTGESISIGEEEFEYNERFVGIRKGKVSGANNPNSKNIEVYDNTDTLRFKCNGNFKQTCRENLLPLCVLEKSYINNGKRIYTSKKGNTDAIKLGREKFIGWYAILRS